MDRKPYELTDKAGSHVAGRLISDRTAPLALTEAEAAYELTAGTIRPWGHAREKAEKQAAAAAHPRMRVEGGPAVGAHQQRHDEEEGRGEEQRGACDRDVQCALRQRHQTGGAVAGGNAMDGADRGAMRGERANRHAGHERLRPSGQDHRRRGPATASGEASGLDTTPLTRRKAHRTFG